MMMIRKSIGILVLLAVAAAGAWAQDDASQAPADESQKTPPPAAFGQDNPPVLVNDNPPISGLDRPSLEPNIQPRSMLLGGVELSESLDSNLGSDAFPAWHSVTRGLAGLTLQRLWSRYQLQAAYIGGAGYYNVAGNGFQQIHELQAEQSYLWRTGQITLRDAASYLPEGSFGYGAYGGAGGFQLGLPGMGTGMGMLGASFGGYYGVLGSQQIGSLGQVPRVSNVTIADVVENLTPRSSVTAAGSYGFVHFTEGSQGLINSQQVGAQAGYNYTLGPKDQVAVMYGFQAFHFPGQLEGADNLDTQLVQFLYGHRVSGRMDMVLGVGPQWTLINDPLLGTTSRLSVSGQAMLRYRFRKAATSLSYERYNTSGSGIFAGAESDIVHGSITRPLGRRYSAQLDVGFAHNKRLQTSPLGVQAGSYNYAFAGFGLRRQFGYNWGAFLGYQWNDQIFDQSFCTPGLPCDRISVRHVVTVGVDWHFRPIRID
jgi:hypothetical protein